MFHTFHQCGQYDVCNVCTCFVFFFTLLHTYSNSNPVIVYLCVLFNVLQSDGQGSGASKNGTG